MKQDFQRIKAGAWLAGALLAVSARAQTLVLGSSNSSILYGAGASLHLDTSNSALHLTYVTHYYFLPVPIQDRKLSPDVDHVQIASVENKRYFFGGVDLSVSPQNGDLTSLAGPNQLPAKVTASAAIGKQFILTHYDPSKTKFKEVPNTEIKNHAAVPILNPPTKYVPVDEPPLVWDAAAVQLSYGQTQYPLVVTSTDKVQKQVSDTNGVDLIYNNQFALGPEQLTLAGISIGYHKENNGSMLKQITDSTTISTIGSQSITSTQQGYTGAYQEYFGAPLNLDFSVLVRDTMVVDPFLRYDLKQPANSAGPGIAFLLLSKPKDVRSVAGGIAINYTDNHFKGSIIAGITF